MSPSYSPDEKKCALPTLPSPCYPKSAATLEEEISSQEPPTSPAPETDDYPDTLPQSRKNALAILLILANFVPMISFGAGMGGGLYIASSLGVTESSQASWIAASYPLTAGAFILMSGRLGSIYGHVPNTADDTSTCSQAPKASWTSPYEITLLILSILLFLAFNVWEYRFATHPIMPLTIFRAPSFAPVIVVVLFSFMSYGTFIWYLIAWQQEIRHWSVLSTAWGLTPLAIFSATGAFIAAWLVPRLAVQWILVIGAMVGLVAEVLVATMPEQQLYWKQMFPATVIQSFCPDFIYTAAQIKACNSVGRRDQGVAGSLIGTLQLYATSVGLGFAVIVGTHAGADAAGGGGPADGYRAALCFGMGMAGMALVIGLVFVRMPKDTREGWQMKDAV